jgi:hypothetical protein
MFLRQRVNYFLLRSGGRGTPIRLLWKTGAML